MIRRNLFFLGFNRHANATSQLLVFIGFFYIGVLPDNFLQIRLLNNGRILLAILVCATWARDFGGYITGLFFRNGHPIAIHINSKKTYEGAIMGGLFTFVTIVFFNFEIEPILTSKMHPPLVIVHEN
ncbi:MAG TPA: hypothetical protein DEP80_06195 [Anaerolineae bacterium]|nr:hypothetical protein [Anaerolineae bacterium]HCC79178.1 hypothetical protein [Anaerolineae bacterium]HCM97511.1 hypothetical protein [Anaerolineae bacterium]